MCISLNNPPLMSKKRKSTPDNAAPTADRRAEALTWLANGGLLLIMIGTVIPLIDPWGTWFRYIYAAGAVMALAGRLFNPYQGDNVRVKRLMRIESWGAIFFCTAVFFMFYQDASSRDWLAFTLAGGALQIYTSIMIPRAQKKKDTPDAKK